MYRGVMWMRYLMYNKVGGSDIAYLASHHNSRAGVGGVTHGGDQREGQVS